MNVQSIVTSIDSPWVFLATISWTHDIVIHAIPRFPEALRQGLSGLQGWAPEACECAGWQRAKQEQVLMTHETCKKGHCKDVKLAFKDEVMTSSWASKLWASLMRAWPQRWSKDACRRQRKCNNMSLESRDCFVVRSKSCLAPEALNSACLLSYFLLWVHLGVRLCSSHS